MALVSLIGAAGIFGAKAGREQIELNHNELLPPAQQIDTAQVARLQADLDANNREAGVVSIAIMVLAGVPRLFGETAAEQDESL